LTPFLKQWGFNTAKDVVYVPCSGYTGENIKTPVDKAKAPWYESGQSLFDVLDAFESLKRDDDGPVRLPIVGKYREMGTTCVLGKLECGTLRVGQDLLMMPVGQRATLIGLIIEDTDVGIAKTGENVVLKLKGIEEEEVHEGFVICSADRELPKKSKRFRAQVAVLQLLEHKPLVTAGYLCVLHVHALAVECQISKLVFEVDKKTGKPTKKRPRFFKDNGVGVIDVEIEETIAIEEFKLRPQLGRFTLRDEGRTIAVGKVLEVAPEK
jgi:peptide chain release factor subunit 3